MFLVFNKEKIGSYIVLLSTVLILFGLAIGLRKDKSVETNANTFDNKIIENTLNNYLKNKVDNNTEIKKENIQNIMEKYTNIID